MESYIDELAHAAGKDPYSSAALCWRTGPISSACSTRSPRKATGANRCRQGRGRGIAIHECYGTIVGQVAEVTVAARARCASTASSPRSIAGTWSIPSIVEAQIESGIIFGLSAALYGDMTIKGGAIEQTNFDSYQMVRLADTPKIEVYLALTGGSKWGGIGEPGTAPTAPAVANAVFAATGTRARSLPLKNLKLSGPA